MEQEYLNKKSLYKMPGGYEKSLVASLRIHESQENMTTIHIYSKNKKGWPYLGNCFVYGEMKRTLERFIDRIDNKTEIDESFATWAKQLGLENIETNILQYSRTRRVIELSCEMENTWDHYNFVFKDAGYPNQPDDNENLE